MDAPLADRALPVIAATQAVLQVLLLALAGAYLEWTGQLGRTKRSAISNTTYRVLLPCLLFSSVSESLSAERLKTLWVLPFYAVLYLAIGTTVGWVVGRLVSRPDDDFGRPHVMLSIAVANFVYFPLILIPAVVLQGALHPAGTNLLAEVKKAAGFLGLYVIACNLYTFGFGSWILRSHVRAKAREAAQAEAAASSAGAAAGGSDDGDNETGSVGDAPSAVTASLSASADGGGGAYDERPLDYAVAPAAAPSQVVTRPAPLLPSASARRLEMSGSVRFFGAAATAAPAAVAMPAKGAAGTSAQPPEEPTANRLIAVFKRLVLQAPPERQEALARVLELVQVFTEPPIAATLAAIIVGMTPALKALLWVTPPAAATPAPVDPSAGLAAGSWSADVDLTGLGGPNHAAYTQLTLYPDSALRLVRNVTAAAVGGGSSGSSAAWTLCAAGDSFASAPAGDQPATAAFGLPGQLCFNVGAAVAAVATGAAAAQATPTLTPAPVVVAPLGPTIAAASVSFAGAVSPMVAIMMGSAIVERRDAVAAPPAAGGSDAATAAAAVAAAAAPAKPVVRP